MCSFYNLKLKKKKERKIKYEIVKFKLKKKNQYYILYVLLGTNSAVPC